MENIDGRKLSRCTLEQLRIMAVKRVKSGESPESIIAALGFHRSQIYKWLSLYREGGEDALKSKKAPGKQPKLNGKQLKELYDIITQKNPLQLQFEFALWTRAMVRELIKTQYNIRLSEVSVGRLLRTLGLSPQKPVYKAYQRNEEKVKVWKEECFPQIKKLAKQEGAEIYFGDEASVRSDHHSGSTWAPVGKTPIVESTGGRFGINLISAVSTRGKLRFMTVDGKMNADNFIKFLKRLIYKADRSVYLIVDGHPVHKSKKVVAFVETTKGQLRLYILPPYSPHLNPDEWVWNWLKNHKLGRTSTSGPDHLKRKVYRFLKKLQATPALVKGFFLDKNLAYIQS